MVNSRDVYIWGCGHLGRAIKRSLDKNGVKVKSFCDRNPGLVSTSIDKLKVIDPEEIFSAARQKEAFIITASARHREEIEKDCIAVGLVKKEDYLSYIHISRPEVAIDVAGRCPACPSGNTKNPREEGYMTASAYEKVLNKLLSELPLLMHIELYTWGEPFLNPELAEIVRMTEMHVPCTVATNLQISDKLEDVVKAQPSHMIISASGYGKSYEANHSGASWQIFSDNIRFLRELIAKYNPGTQFTVLYHLYRNNQKQDLGMMRDSCLESGLKLNTAWGYMNPYEKILDYCEGRDSGSQASRFPDILAWDLDHALELAKTEAHKPCLCQRIFPIINWDLSVSLCHTYYGPVIADSFLDVPLDELIRLRHNQPQCELCQKHGLHRLDIELLLERYSAKDIVKKGA